MKVVATIRGVGVVVPGIVGSIAVGQLEVLPVEAGGEMILVVELVIQTGEEDVLRGVALKGRQTVDDVLRRGEALLIGNTRRAGRAGRSGGVAEDGGTGYR